MGIYDRDYIRHRPAPRGTFGRGGVAPMRLWSVNTWLIVACIGIFVVDGLTPKNPGLWKPVEVIRDVPHYVDLVGGGQYGTQSRGQENATLRSAQPVFIRDVLDYSANTPQHVGHIVYEWMPPLKRWLYFSTDTAFRSLQVWRFVGFQFLHSGLLHLLFNMVALYFFGPIVEQFLGRKRYLAFYLLCGMCGALMYLLLNLSGFVVSLYMTKPIVPGLLFNSPAMPLVGASAGVFGVLMAGAYRAPSTIVLVFLILPMRLATFAYALLALAVVNLFMGSVNAGGEAGHLGGAIAGFYFIRHPHHLHGFFDFVGWVDPTSHHYQKQARRIGDRPPAPGPARDQVDRILDKINTHGLHSLSEKEKRVLREASERD